MKISVLRQLYMISKYCAYSLIIQCVVASSLLAARDVNAQKQSIEDIHVNISEQNKKLSDILDQITEMTDFEFAMNSKNVNLQQSILLGQYSASLATVLRDISAKAELVSLG